MHELLAGKLIHRCDLLLQLLVLLLRLTLLLRERVSHIVHGFRRIGKDLDLDTLDLNLNLAFLDLLPELIGLLYSFTKLCMVLEGIVLLLLVRHHNSQLCLLLFY